ncbi:MAG: permease-like cell division protein FtsX [Acidimicrobiales bacterium]
MWFETDATEAQIDAVAGQLRSVPGVKLVRYVDHDETMVEFAELFADDPSSLDVVTAKDLPTSWRIAVDPSVDRRALRGRFRSLPGVKDVIEVVAPPTAEECEWRRSIRAFVVWVEPDANEDVHEQVRTKLEDPGVLLWSYSDQEANYAEFQAMFADDPGFVDVQPAEIPTSYRVVAAPDADQAALEATFARIDGVRDVLNALDGTGCR